MLATWFGSGLSPFAPGTFGSLAALPFGYGILLYGDTLMLGVMIMALFWPAVIAAKHVDNHLGKRDSSAIVIDEVLGVWLTMLAITDTPTVAQVMGAFALFRFFDILKPFPIRWIDRKLKSPLGVILDDLVAGFFALIVFWGIRYFVTAG